MFNGDWTTIRVTQMRTQEFLHSAERSRLVRLALAGQGGRARFYRPLLAKLGRQLVVWGDQLQAQHDSLPRAEADTRSLALTQTGR